MGLACPVQTILLGVAQPSLLAHPAAILARPGRSPPARARPSRSLFAQPSPPHLLVLARARHNPAPLLTSLPPLFSSSSALIPGHLASHLSPAHGAASPTADHRLLRRLLDLYHGGEMATPRSHKRQHEPTTLMSLGDDMLAEILCRLPSLPSLARAAFACPRLRIIAASIVNRFISPAPLLGYFISVIGGDMPSFHRALLLSDRDVAAIVRRSDFHLADFEDYNWRLMDCRHGLLLLTSSRSMAVFDPVTSSRLRIPHFTSNVGGKSSFHCFLLSCADATSFRVLCLESTGSCRVRPHLYSSCTGEWCSHSLAPRCIKSPRRVDPHSNHNLPMYAGGRIYWRTHAALGTLTTLDVGSMEFSHVALPNDVHDPSSYAVGDTEDGTTSIVSVSTKYHQKLDLRVWFLKEEKGSSSWERQWSVDASELDILAGPVAPSKMLKVYNVTNGVVLLSMGSKNNGIRYLAFRLEDTLCERESTTKTNTKRLSPILADFCTSTGWLYPCFMAWPRPSLKAPGSIENASTCESNQEAAGDSNKKQV